MNNEKQFSLKDNHPAFKWWDRLRSTRLCNGTQDKGYYTDKYFGFGNRMYKWLCASEIVAIYREYNSDKTCSLCCNAIQLESVGIPGVLLNHIKVYNIPVYYVKEYPTGYSQIKVEHTAISSIIGEKHYNYYDIPTQWLTMN